MQKRLPLTTLFKHLTMTITFITKGTTPETPAGLSSTPATASSAIAEVFTPASTDQPRHQIGKPNKGHSRPLNIQGIDLNTPQRLLAGHVMAFLKTSHSTLNRWIDEGKFPAPDGYQGRRPFWFASTIRRHVG